MGEMFPFLSLFLSNTVNKKKAGALWKWITVKFLNNGFYLIKKQNIT